MTAASTLDPNVVRILARRRHDEWRARSDTPDLADPLLVGRCAANFAKLYFFGNIGISSSAQVTTAECAGMLAQAMERWGFTFEELSDLAEYSVAAVVSGLTPDVRMPPGKRTDFHCSTLGAADPLSQIVKFAALSIGAGRVAAMPPADFALHAGYLRKWADEGIRLIDAMKHLHGHARFEDMIRDLKGRLAAIAKTTETVRRPRRTGTAPLVTATPI